jgi:hypothetical protein
MRTASSDGSKTAAELREMAHRARRLAAAQVTEHDRQRLEDYAGDLERQAIEMETGVPRRPGG